MVPDFTESMSASETSEAACAMCGRPTVVKRIEMELAAKLNTVYK